MGRPRKPVDPAAPPPPPPNPNAPRTVGRERRSVIDRAFVLYRQAAQGVPDNDIALIDCRHRLEMEGLPASLEEVKTWREAYQWDLTVAHDDSRLFEVIRRVAEHQAKVAADPHQVRATVNHLANLAQSMAAKATAIIASCTATDVDTALQLADAALRIMQASVQASVLMEKEAPKLGFGARAGAIDGEVVRPGQSLADHKQDSVFTQFGREKAAATKQ